MIDIDTSDFDEFAGDVAAAVTEIGAGIPKVIGKGALNVKNEWNDAFRGSASFKGIAGAVTYDTRTGQGWSEAEVGPRRGAPGSLANIAHFGSSRGGGTVADPQTFLDAEEPNLTKALEDLIAQALG